MLSSAEFLNHFNSVHYFFSGSQVSVAGLPLFHWISRLNVTEVVSVVLLYKLSLIFLSEGPQRLSVDFYVGDFG
jgi:hypothetical protein